MNKRMAKKLAKRQAERAVAAKLEKILEERENLKKEKSAVKKAEVPKTEAKKTEVKGTDDRKPDVQAAVKAETKKSSPSRSESSAKKTNIFYQFGGQQIEQQEIIGLIKNEWKAQGHMVKDLKSLEVYLKPEEHTAYYVINDHIKGSIAVG